MKEETNDTGTTTSTPSEAAMNDMYKNAWLDFQTDAQEAKQGLNRRYAIMVETFGSYKDMPYGVKEIVKQDYAAYKAKWAENGEEQQKRFGVKEPDPAIQVTGTTEQKPTEAQIKQRQEFLEKLQEQRKPQLSNGVELER